MNKELRIEFYREQQELLEYFMILNNENRGRVLERAMFLVEQQIIKAQERQEQKQVIENIKNVIEFPMKRGNQNEQ